jgi:hypothetical protein
VLPGLLGTTQSQLPLIESEQPSPGQPSGQSPGFYSREAKRFDYPWAPFFE